MHQQLKYKKGPRVGISRIFLGHPKGFLKAISSASDCCKGKKIQ